MADKHVPGRHAEYDRQDESPFRLGNLSLARGEERDLGSHEGFRDWLMPVITARNGQKRVEGTAVCVGPGAYITAGHVVAHLGRALNGTPNAWIARTKGSNDPDDPASSRGQMLAVDNYRSLGSADLASIGTSLPAGGDGHFAAVRWSLRMPKRNELVAILGYPEGTAQWTWGGDTGSDPTDVVLEYPLRVGVGVVTAQQTSWALGGVRPSPGFETDAPMYSAMSGGAVLDQRGRLLGFAATSTEPDEYPDWNGFVTLAGVAFQLEVDLATPSGAKQKNVPVEALLDQFIPYDLDDTFQGKDPETGRPRYCLPDVDESPGC
ncbi:S1 family peptidase [Nocardioides abyssi]|uniref:Serine protease n=1 Tax=Nocardioides abyssi TaxID=3058370 RepID=A0ABT8EQZ1_9ACTN|nr:serine protease [Nocardioides abyssi]MDN4160428.1 serine protease [Nocardioides abyssi]